jgi:hypothetical protein
MRDDGDLAIDRPGERALRQTQGGSVQRAHGGEVHPSTVLVASAPGDEPAPSVFRSFSGPGRRGVFGRFVERDEFTFGGLNGEAARIIAESSESQ